MAAKWKITAFQPAASRLVKIASYNQLPPTSTRLSSCCWRGHGLIRRAKFLRGWSVHAQHNGACRARISAHGGQAGWVADRLEDRITPL
jgi:hypothetical protein